MYNFILQTIVMLSLGGIIYLFARALPRVTDNAPVFKRRDYVGELIKKLPIEKTDAFFAQLVGKLLRKVKITILKLDNLLAKHLNSLRKDSDKSDNRPNLFEKKEEGSDNSEIK